MYASVFSNLITQTHNLVRVSQYIKHIYHCVFVVIATIMYTTHILAYSIHEILALWAWWFL